MLSMKKMSVLFAMTGLMTAFSAQADYVWIEREGDALKVYQGDLDAQRGKPDANGARAYLADGKELPLAGESDYLTVSAPASEDIRFTGHKVIGDGVLVYFHAKQGRNDTKAVSDLELVPTEAGGNTFKLIWKGNAVAASQVNVSTSEGWRRVLKPGKDGTVTLGTPFAGLYVLEVSAKVNGSVTVDGKKYDDVRHTATLTFDVAP